MIKRTSLAMLAMALVLAAAFFTLIGGEVAEDSEAANMTFDDNNLRYMITSSTEVEVSRAVMGYPSEIVIPSTVEHHGNTYSVKSIGYEAFYGCTSLTSIEIPNSVTTIDGYAFQGCTSLSEITISDSVATIGSYAFEECESLTSIEIPNGVTTIGQGVFNGCISLTSINVKDGNTAYSSVDGILFNYEKTTLIRFPVRSAITSYTAMPDSVTHINGYAFEDCTSLETITIGTGVKIIDKAAFYSCTSLTEITIPDNVTTIGWSAFCLCASLKTVTIGSGVTSIENYAFSNCASLASITVDNENNNYCSVDGILFNHEKTTLIQYPIGCETTSYTTMPDSVTQINSYAFEGCTSLETITIGTGVESIGASASENSIFTGCTSLAEINVKDGNTAYSSVDGILFNYEKTTLIRFPIGSAITSYTVMPNSVTTIGDKAFCDCISLTEIAISDNVTTIGWGAFDDCTSLETVTIGKGVETISYYTFEECESLTSIKIPDNVKTIEYCAFYNCASLKTVTIGSGATSVDDSVFSNCTSLAEINVKDGNTAYSSVDGILFDYEKTTLIIYPLGKTNKLYAVPYGVTTIGGYAFYGCTSLSEITMPNSVTTIGDSAFSGCTSLTSIKMPNSVTTIGPYAFEECESLTSIKIPDNVTTIGDNTFYGCTLLETVTIGKGVETIGYYAFGGCTSLTEIAIPDNVKTIEYCAFYNCASLKTVTIGSGVTSIDGFAFYHCTSLEILKIGACNITTCNFSFEEGLEYICIAEGAAGKLDILLDNYEFYDSDGEKITDWSKIAGQNYKIGKDGKMHYYDGPLPGPEPENNDSSGLNIGLIVGIIVAVVAIAGVGAYFYLRTKKQ